MENKLKQFQDCKYYNNLPDQYYERLYDLMQQGLTLKQAERLVDFYGTTLNYPEYGFVKHFCNPNLKYYRYGNSHPEYYGTLNENFIYKPVFPPKNIVDVIKESPVDEPELGEDKDYKKKKKYYNKMLGDKKMQNLEDLSKMNIFTKEEYWEKRKKEIEERKKMEEEMERLKREKEMNESKKSCPVCKESDPLRSGYLLDKNENENENVEQKKENNDIMSCIHHTKKYFSTKDNDPKNFQNKSGKMIQSVPAAGIPYKNKSPPLYLFREGNIKGNEWIDN